MHITQIKFYKSSIQLKKPFIISLGASYVAENIYVTIHTSEGLIGYGECSPSLTINGEHADTCIIIGQLLAKHLINQNPLQLDDCSLLMDRIVFGNASIKSAIDIALYDIAAQAAGKPLYEFIGGNNAKQLITDYTVGINTPSIMAEEALQIKQNGYPVIKVKLGTTKIEDVERIKTIRTTIGNEIPLRIDANQGWDYITAIATLNALADFNIQFCEEPIPRWDYNYLNFVRQHSPIPLMADESCCDHHDANQLILLKACDMFNIKLGKSSGIHKALKIIKLAEENNIKLQIGGFLESRLATTASAHLALASNNVEYCDFDAPLFAVSDPIIDGLTYESNGKLTVPTKPGLGATIDPDYLKTLNAISIQ